MEKEITVSTEELISIANNLRTYAGGIAEQLAAHGPNEILQLIGQFLTEDAQRLSKLIWGE